MANKIILVLLLCQLMFWEVQLVNLEGREITIYQPCGLAFIKFTKISWNYWEGKIHFHRYSNLQEFDFLMIFEKEVNVFTDLSLSNIIIEQPDETTFTVKTSLHSTDKYVVFNVQLANLDPNESDVPVVSIVMMNNLIMCDDHVRSEHLIATNTDSGTPKRKAHTCGRKSRKNYELMSLRTIAKPGDWPWYVAVNNVGDKSPKAIVFTGSIVSSTAVISTALSVFVNGVKAQTNQIEIVAGSVNLTDINDIGRQTPSVVEIIVHPAYTYGNPPLGDLAIIKVRGLVFTEYVQPICLWGPLFYNTLLYEKEAVVAGYGDTSYNNNLLRVTNTMIQYDTKCIKDHSYYSKSLKYFAFCGGYGNTSSSNPINGDGGTGLVLPKEEADQKITWYLRGVFSTCIYKTRTTCDPRHFVGYVDVTPYYAWIYENAGLESNLEDSLIT